MLMTSALFLNITRRRVVTVYPLLNTYHTTPRDIPEKRRSQEVIVFFSSANKLGNDVKSDIPSGCISASTGGFS
jgi:hypothetical protein